MRRLPFFAALAVGMFVATAVLGEQSKPDSIQKTAETSIKSFADLQRLAGQWATGEYRPEPQLSPELAGLTYDQYREIQFKHESAIWADGEHPFWLEFFHRGFVQQDRIECFLISRPQPRRNRTAEVTEVAYSPDQFHFGELEGSDSFATSISKSVGYAGLKIAGRFTPDGDPQELLTFLGSSYYRARTESTVYGSSARGLAVNVGMNQPEEFPDFKIFWIFEPGPDDRELHVLGLLDTPTLTGAYEFVFTPREEVSVMEITATLYFRNSPLKLAIAPLTSMWIWGDGLAGPTKDNRPSVHDADGLLIHADDHWQWRSFARLSYPSVSSVAMEELNGFGLMQRDRVFDHYRDSNARYHDRPSIWVEPTSDWGSGRIELLEIPGAHEGVDNIGAYFVSDAPVDVHQPMHLSYRTHFFRDEVKVGGSLSSSRATFQSLSVDRRVDAPSIQLTIDFDCDPITKRLMATDPVNDLNVKTVRGIVEQQAVHRTTTGYQVQLTVVPTESAPIELEVSVSDRHGRAMGETFRYLCPHEEPTFVYPAVYTRIE